MKKVVLSMLAVSAFVFTSCSEDEVVKPEVKINIPSTYTFEVDGKSTVSYTGQLARIAMGNELKDALNNSASTTESLNKMFKDGKGFADATLDASGKKLRSTIAAATYSNVSTAEAEALRTKADGYITDFISNVKPNWTTDASSGQAGRLEYTKDDATKYRYVNAKGIEMNQAMAKTLIGSVYADQTINKYVAQEFIDANKADHLANKAYKDNPANKFTKLQHGWDEAYGYIFGEEGAGKPNPTERKSFLNKYLKSVNSDPDFSGILDEVYNALKHGRAAINVNQFDVAGEQAKIIRMAISKVIGVRAVYYLQNGKGANTAKEFHNLSEGYGFVQSLRFAHDKNGNQISKAKVDELMNKLEANNGFWSITDDELDAMSKTIADMFDFTVAQAASSK